MNTDLDMLRDYFRNIMMACDNNEKDERPYIRGIAKCGIEVIEKLLKKS